MRALVDGLDFGQVANFVDHVLLELEAQHTQRAETAGKTLDALTEEEIQAIEESNREGSDPSASVANIVSAANNHYESKTALHDIGALRELMAQNPKDGNIHTALYLMLFVAGHSGDRLKELFTERGHRAGQSKGGQARGRDPKLTPAMLAVLMPLVKALEQGDASKSAPALAKTVLKELTPAQRNETGIHTNADEADLERALADAIRASRRPPAVTPDVSMLADGLYGEHGDDLMWRVWIGLRRLQHEGVVTRSKS
jgi:hypothetical protein